MKFWGFLRRRRLKKAKPSLNLSAQPHKKTYISCNFLYTMTTFSTSNATKAVASLMLFVAAVIATIQGMSTMNAQVGTIWMGWDGMGLDGEFKIFVLVCIPPKQHLSKISPRPAPPQIEWTPQYMQNSSRSTCLHEKHVITHTHLFLCCLSIVHRACCFKGGGRW
jgi:hypothetical protein